MCLKWFTFVIMKDRILKFINKEGISPAHFADEIGVQRSSVSHILSGRNNPSFDFIQKILQRYKSLNSEWLIMGIGDVYKKNEKNISFVSDIRPKEPSVVQKDLFSGTNVFPHEIPPKIVNDKTSEINQSKVVDKIIVFYSDKTFSEFKPSS